VEEIVVTAFFLQTVVLMIPSAVAMLAARSTALLLSATIGKGHHHTRIGPVDPFREN
jgi:hypothetical protein